VAVLILLFGQSTGALRAAVALAVITIVLLAFSMAIRPSVDMVRVDIEHRVLDEMERIRMRAQSETQSVARHTHRALTDHIQQLNETISDLRAQVDEVQAFGYFEPGPPAIGPGPAGGPPGVRRTETVHVTRRTTYDDTGTVYGSRAAHDARSYDPRPPVDAEWYDDRQDDDRPWTVVPHEPRALPAARGESWADERDDRHRGYDDRRRYDDRDRGYDRDRHDERDRGYERERGYDRGHDRYDDRRHDDRRHDDRRSDDRRYDDRGHERDRRSHDRYDDRDRGYDRYERDRPPIPRPRSPEW
jgi:hypothetical protein